jgi:uncharacterized phiE125 gp8 family phage protein
MNGTWVRTTEPASQPIMLDDVKEHLRIDATDEDVVVTGYVSAATQWAEEFMNRALVTQTWKLYLDEWPANGVITLPRPPLVSVTSVKYTSDAGVEATFTSTNYHVDIVTEPGRIVLKSTASWPSTVLADINGIVVEYVAGYTVVPQAIQQALRFMVGHYYENREAYVLGNIQAIRVPDAAKALLYPWRVP